VSTKWLESLEAAGEYGNCLCELSFFDIRVVGVFIWLLAWSILIKFSEAQTSSHYCFSRFLGPVQTVAGRNTDARCWHAALL